MVICGNDSELAMGIAAIAVCFFSLLFFSAVAGICLRKRKNGEMRVLVFKVMPALCAVMGGGFFLLCLVCLSVFHRITGRSGIIFVPIFAAAVLGTGFVWFLCYARRNEIPPIKSLFSFFIGFIFSAAFPLTIFALSVAMQISIWRALELPTSPRCELEMKRMVALCPEFHRRIRFKSGKTVGLHVDTCGLDEFRVYEIGDSSIYLESQAALGGPSYIVNPRLEKVFYVMGSSAVELKGGLICGMSRWKGDSEAIFEVYGFGKESSFKSREIALADLMGEKRLIGTLDRFSFKSLREAQSE